MDTYLFFDKLKQKQKQNQKRACIYIEKKQGVVNFALQTRAMLTLPFNIMVAISIYDNG
jgi:hypothetical protein